MNPGIVRRIAVFTSMILLALAASPRCPAHVVTNNGALQLTGGTISQAAKVVQPQVVCVSCEVSASRARGQGVNTVLSTKQDIRRLLTRMVLFASCLSWNGNETIELQQLLRPRTTLPSYSLASSLLMSSSVLLI